MDILDLFMRKKSPMTAHFVITKRFEKTNWDNTSNVFMKGRSHFNVRFAIKHLHQLGT